MPKVSLQADLTAIEPLDREVLRAAIERADIVVQSCLIAQLRDNVKD
jgi:RNase P/RNase MRP subunit p30